MKIAEYEATAKVNGFEKSGILLIENRKKTFYYLEHHHLVHMKSSEIQDVRLTRRIRA